MPRTKKIAAPKKEKTVKKTTKKVAKKEKVVDSPKKMKAEKVSIDKEVKQAEQAKQTEQVENPTIEEKAQIEIGATGKDLGSASKQQIIDQFATKNGDTGSPEVQIALSTQKIFNLSQHLIINPKDNHSRRGLLKIIAKRRRILHYLQDKDNGRYKILIKKLGLKK